MKCSCPRSVNDRGEVVHYVDQLCQVHRYEDPKDVRIMELEKMDFDNRLKIASFCEGTSKIIHAIDTLPKDADTERTRALLDDTGKKLRSAVMRATD